jgi:hypothetical protein
MSKKKRMWTGLVWIAEGVANESIPAGSFEFQQNSTDNPKTSKQKPSNLAAHRRATSTRVTLGGVTPVVVDPTGYKLKRRIK